MRQSITRPSSKPTATISCFGMAGDRDRALVVGREHARLLAHRAVLGGERPEDQLLGAGRREPLAARRPGHRAHLGRIAGHAHVLGVGEAPAVQRRLLHGGDEELPSGLNITSRCEPFQASISGAACAFGKPQRHAAVVRDREPQALRREREPADARRQVERFRSRPWRCARTPACRRDQATAPSGPSATRSIQRCLASVASVSLSPFASVATTLPSSPPVRMRVPSLAAARMPPPCTATRCSAPSGATNSSASSPSTNDGASAEEMHGDDRRARRDRLACDRRRRGLLAVRVESRHQATSRPRMLSKPLRIFSSGRLRPMNTTRLVALLAVLPFALVVAVEHHVHALEHEALRVVLERQDALAAQDVRPLGLRRGSG